MIERDKILDDLKQAEGKALARTIKTTGKELDITREQYETCEDVTKRVRLAGTTVPHSKDMLQRQVDAMDHKIDRLVYELYGLSDEEIQIMEA